MSANKAIKRGKTVLDKSGKMPGKNNAEQQTAERADLLARFREKTAVPRCAVCGGQLEKSEQYPEAGLVHKNDSDDTHMPQEGTS